MKKSLLALAALGAFSGVATAQSSVTLYGTIDMAGRYVKIENADRRVSLGTNGIASSQLGFRGIEYLGGGLKAGFILLADLAPIDSGNVGSKFFGRRATVSLISNAWGELRLGRDYRPDFWNQTIFDAFGTNGLGSSLNVRQLYGGTRADNSIGYFLPSILGGFYGQAMVAASEGGTSLDRAGELYSGRVGFAAGPFDVAVAYGRQRLDLQPGVPDQKTINIGGSWNFGFMKLMGYYDREEISSDRRQEDMWSISGVLPFGQSEVHLGYDYSNFTPLTGSDTTVDQFKITYQYNLSKRTAMYSTASWLKNHDNTQITLPGAGTAVVPFGGDAKGIEFGIRHFF
jgi:predicted porin